MCIGRDGASQFFIHMEDLYLYFLFLHLKKNNYCMSFVCRNDQTEESLIPAGLCRSGELCVLDMDYVCLGSRNPVLGFKRAGKGCVFT